MRLLRFASLMVVAVLCTITLSNAQYVGSKNSNKYHVKTCSSANRILPSNLVEFTSITEAKDAGYVPCKICKPEGKVGASGKSEQSVRTEKTDTGGRCQAITKKGAQCKRNAQAGSKYCWQHQ